MSRALYYNWKKRYEKNGIAVLRDQPRRPHNIPYCITPEIVVADPSHSGRASDGAVRVSLYLQRRYHAYVSPTTILKMFHRHHVDRVSLKKYRPGSKPADAPLQVPGRSVQLDGKFVPRVGRARQRSYQFTAIDEAARFRVLRIYDHDTPGLQSTPSGIPRAFPFAIQKIQTDNGSSFGPQFTWHLFRSPHFPQTHTSGLPGGERQGREKPYKPTRRNSIRKGISNIKKIWLENPKK